MWISRRQSRRNLTSRVFIRRVLAMCHLRKVRAIKILRRRIRRRVNRRLTNRQIRRFRRRSINQCRPVIISQPRRRLPNLKTRPALDKTLLIKRRLATNNRCSRQLGRRHPRPMLIGKIRKSVRTRRFNRRLPLEADKIKPWRLFHSFWES